MITEDELIAELRQIIHDAGGVNAAAERLGKCLSPNYISIVIHGHVKPGPCVYEAMGYRRVVMYEKVEGK